MGVVKKKVGSYVNSLHFFQVQLGFCMEHWPQEEGRCCDKEVRKLSLSPFVRPDPIAYIREDKCEYFRSTNSSLHYE